MRCGASLLLALAIVACSVDPSAPASQAGAPPASAATTAAVLEPGAFPPRMTSTPSAAPGTARARVALAPVRIDVVRLTTPQGEDGHGNTVPSVRPAAIDLVTEGGWHAGGLATMMTVGDLRFYNMGYPSITTMRFIVADEAALPRNAEVALEAAGTAARRRVLAPSLPVTR